MQQGNDNVGDRLHRASPVAVAGLPCADILHPFGVRNKQWISLKIFLKTSGSGH